VDYRNDPNAQKLYAFLKRWLARHPSWAYDQSGWMMTVRTAESVAADLKNETEFAEIGLAGVLRSPDGRLIETVVGWILPWPASAEFKLLVGAITLAAQARQKNERGVAAGLTLVSIALLLLMFLSSE
jgi:hypothetical protein